MNKRNTEGFVLAYVMIVIAVVSAITMALTTSTLNVLKAQEQSVERMQDKYEAMGRIEWAIAQAEANGNSIDSVVCSTLDNSYSAYGAGIIPYSGESNNNDTIVSEIESEIAELVKEQAFDHVTTALTSAVSFFKVSNIEYFQIAENDSDNLSFSVISHAGSVEIKATFSLSYSADITVAIADESEGEEILCSYTLDVFDFSLNFDSYEITSIGGAA